MAGIDHIFWGVRMAEWLWPGLWEVLTIRLRGIEPGQILAHKKSICWADGDENTRPVVTMAGIDHIFGCRMAEWLRLRAFEENGLNIRRLCGGSNPAAKKSIGRADGAKVTSRRYYGRRKPNFKRGQDGRVVKAGALGGTHD